MKSTKFPYEFSEEPSASLESIPASYQNMQLMEPAAAVDNKEKTLKQDRQCPT